MNRDITNVKICFQAQQLIVYAINQSLHYQTNNIILTMGEDFQYTNAAFNFYSMDKLIKLVHIYLILYLYRLKKKKIKPLPQ